MVQLMAAVNAPFGRKRSASQPKNMRPGKLTRLSAPTINEASINGRRPEPRKNSTRCTFTAVIAMVIKKCATHNIHSALLRNTPWSETARLIGSDAAGTGRWSRFRGTNTSMITTASTTKAGRQPSHVINQALPGENTIMPNPVPTSAKPIARPRWLGANHRATTTVMDKSAVCPRALSTP